jgi:hypothetical protein
LVDGKKEKSNPKKIRKELLKAYTDLKKQNPAQEIMRDGFLRDVPGCTRHKISLAFNSFAHLKKEGDEAFFNSLPVGHRALLCERKKIYDPLTTSEECIEDLRELQLEHDGKEITRNFYRLNGKYSDSTWNQFFGTFLEFKRQAGLQLTRHQHKLERELAKHASHDHYRKFFETEVMPYHQKYDQYNLEKEGIACVVVASDMHDRYIDEFSLSILIDRCRILQPEVICLNGDIFDLYEFSKFSQDPRRCDLVDRFKFVHERIFKPLRKVCPDSRIDLIMGNHEFRLLRHLSDRSPYMKVLMSDWLDLQFKDIFKLDEYRINWVSKLDLSAWTKKNVNDELKKNYEIYFDCYAVSHIRDLGFKMSGTNGHHHTLDMISTFFLDRGPCTWVQTPGMCARDEEYLDGMSKWNTGFVEAYINTSTKEVVQCPILTHKDWCMIDGKLYKRSDLWDQEI